MLCILSCMFNTQAKFKGILKNVINATLDKLFFSVTCLNEHFELNTKLNIQLILLIHSLR